MQNNNKACINNSGTYACGCVMFTNAYCDVTGGGNATATGCSTLAGQAVCVCGAGAACTGTQHCKGPAGSETCQ